MARTKSSLLNTLTVTDLRRLLAARERIDTLEKEKAQLIKALSVIENELARLMAKATAEPGKKSPARKKVRRKTTGRKKTVRAKSGPKAAPKKAPAGRAAALAKGKIKLEDVVAGVISKKKGPVAFKDLYAAIVKGKLFKSKSSNFDNVLRRTLSTSKKIKRVGRGMYDVA